MIVASPPAENCEKEGSGREVRGPRGWRGSCQLGVNRAELTRPCVRVFLPPACVWGWVPPGGSRSKLGLLVS